MNNNAQGAIDDLLTYINGTYFGKYQGKVVDNKDPESLGRLLVDVPGVLHGHHLWAVPCLPFAGDDMGMYSLPKNGSYVWVEFERGDSSFPIWTGCFWGKGQLPKNEKGTEVSSPVRMIKSEKGMMIHFDDDAEKLTISDKNGNNIITMEVGAAASKIRMQAKIKIVVEAPKIELVENSTHPLVFGDNLLQYLNQIVNIYNAHLHAGEMALGVFPVTPAPPVMPMPPATASLLSTKVTTG